MSPQKRSPAGQGRGAGVCARGKEHCRIIPLKQYIRIVEGVGVGAIEPTDAHSIESAKGRAIAKAMASGNELTAFRSIAEFFRSINFLGQHGGMS